MTTEIATRYEVAELIAALINLEEMHIIMHVDNGALDVAIESILSDLPPYYQRSFRFMDTVDGRRCVEPADIATAIVEADCGMFVSNVLNIRINPVFAHVMLNGMGFERAERQRLSEKLIAALKAEIERLEETSLPRRRAM